MSSIRVVVLGANGFVGQSLVRTLVSLQSVELYTTSRQQQRDSIYFDILEISTWANLSEIKPDVIIDASGYGVIKHQTDLETLYRVNYLDKRELIDYLYSQLPSLFWLQIGTAFEYSLENEALDEKSPCFPKTHYGISKCLLSNYLLNAGKGHFAILRPFGMFGEGEDQSKLFPLLINAQKVKKAINLSDGQQQRDYFYVNDLSKFVGQLLSNRRVFELDGEMINVGTGVPMSIREIGNIMAGHIPDFDSTLWNWGAIQQRQGENTIFYNASSKAMTLGFQTTDLGQALMNTVNYYYKL